MKILSETARKQFEKPKTPNGAEQGRNFFKKCSYMEGYADVFRSQSHCESQCGIMDKVLDYNPGNLG